MEAVLAMNDYLFGGLSPPKWLKLNWKWLFKHFWTVVVIHLLSICLILSGCQKLITFIEYAEQDLPIVMQMVSNITTVVAPAISPEIAAAGALVMTAFVAACGQVTPGQPCSPTSIVGSYEAQCPPSNTVTPAGCPDLLQKVQAGIIAIQGQLSNLLGLVKALPATIATEIVQGVTLAASTIAGILALIPPSGAATPAAMKAQAKATTNRPLEPTALKSAFNNIFAAKFPRAAIQ